MMDKPPWKRAREVGYHGPFVCVDGVLIEGGKVLLIDRALPPLGWAIPGGHLEYEEEPRQGCARELLEETGLHVRVGALVGYTNEFPGRPAGAHNVTLSFMVHREDSNESSRPGDDAKAVNWFPLDGIPELPMPQNLETLRRARQLHE